MGVKNNKPFAYNNKLISREGNVLYYGDRGEKYFVRIKILDSKMIKDLQVSTKLSIELLANDPSKKGAVTVVKKAEREGLYTALDIASVWLDRGSA